MRQRASSFLFVILAILIISGCSSQRRNSQAAKVVELLKDGKYQEVKQLCHYNPTWDTNDSIFHQSVAFIHSYLEKYGEPSQSDYKTSTDSLGGNKIIRVYLSRASDYDTSLRFAYIEMDFDNLARNFSDQSAVRRKIAETALNAEGPRISNFYLVRMKKDQPITS